jgi:hypothetical protein
MPFLDDWTRMLNTEYEVETVLIPMIIIHCVRIGWPIDSPAEVRIMEFQKASFEKFRDDEAARKAMPKATLMPLAIQLLKLDWAIENDVVSAINSFMM